MDLVLLNRNIARLRRDVRLQSSEIEQLIALVSRWKGGGMCFRAHSRSAGGSWRFRSALSGGLATASRPGDTLGG